MKTFWIILIFTAFQNSAYADTYHRFWRGTKLPTLDWTQFAGGLNQVFVPATVRTGAGKGMIAYEPVFSRAARGLPDEIALVSYADKPAYDALYSTDPGKAYQMLHWDYFDRSGSKSLVPQPFSGGVSLEQAYDLHPEYADWKANTTTVLVFFRKEAETDSDYLKRSAKHLNSALTEDQKIGIYDRVALIAQGYWIEYVSAKNSIDSSACADLIMRVNSASPEVALIRPGAGVNLQF